MAPETTHPTLVIIPNNDANCDMVHYRSISQSQSIRYINRERVT